MPDRVTVAGTASGLGLTRREAAHWFAKGLREVFGGCFVDKHGTPTKILAVLAVYAWHSWHYGRLDDVLPSAARRLKKKDDDGCGPTLGMLDMVDAAVSFKVSTVHTRVPPNATKKRKLSF